MDTNKTQPNFQKNELKFQKLINSDIISVVELRVLVSIIPLERYEPKEEPSSNDATEVVVFSSKIELVSFNLWESDFNANSSYLAQRELSVISSEKKSDGMRCVRRLIVS